MIDSDTSSLIPHKILANSNPDIKTDNKSNSSKNSELWVRIRIPCTGLRHYSGISSSYSNQYPPQLNPIILKTEFIDIIDRVNQTIRDFWPCDTCYYFGYGCSCCTCGLSICIPNYCATYSEKYAVAYLKNISLKAKYYDRKISFTLVKQCCGSYIEIRYPASLQDAEESVNYCHSNLPMPMTTPPLIQGQETGIMTSPAASEESENGNKVIIHIPGMPFISKQQAQSRLKEL